MKNPFKKHHLQAPWERTFDKVATPFEHFLHQQTTTGLILMAMTAVALILANTPLAGPYHHFFETELGLKIGHYEIEHSLHHWINDGLMAFFFFLVGLEIKREILVGELSKFQNALLPILAAIGGMAVPALLYFAINQGLPSENGWGIPMATDIAFAISALVLLGKRVPASLVTFLVALAIVDDLGAVAIIALFYTDQIYFIPLLSALGFFLLLIVFNRFGIHKPLPYFIIGVFMWAAMLESGVHATVAGVLAALAIPARPKFNPAFLEEKMTHLVQRFKQHPIPQNYQLNEEQQGLLEKMEETVQAVEPPLNRLEHGMHLPVSLLIIPLFALANAGIAIDFGHIDQMLFEPVTLGVMVGLVVGKVLGIAGVSWIAIQLNLAKLPTGANFNQLLGVSFLGGIGFTMSIFIASLAWSVDNPMLLQAKTGILFASILAGVVGYLWLYYASKKRNDSAHP